MATDVGQLEQNSEAADTSDGSIEDLKEKGNVAFKRAALLRRTTAGKQYLSEAKSYYIQAIQQLGLARADAANLALTCALHSNLAAVYLQEVPPRWTEAKAATDIALTIDPQHAKARFRRAQALLQDNREGLSEEALREALCDLEAVQKLEPANKQVREEVNRVTGRIQRLESKRIVPSSKEILQKHIATSLLERGGDCLESFGYVWGQSETLVHVFVPARGVRMSKNAEVECEIQSRKLAVKLFGNDGQTVMEIDSFLHKPVQPDESSWQLEEGGLVLHIELAKNKFEDEHWERVWQGHPCTMAPTAKEQKQLQKVAQAACRAEAEEEKPKIDEEKLRRWKEALPGIDVQWGDTSIESIRQGFCDDKILRKDDGEENTYCYLRATAPAADPGNPKAMWRSDDSFLSQACATPGQPKNCLTCCLKP
eukprot:s1542_g26.t1